MRTSDRPAAGDSRTPWGIDFSGARNAADAIWIAEGRLERGVLRVSGCAALAARAPATTDPRSCCEALAALIGANPDGVFGCDFPFSLPRQLIPEESWEEYALAFPGRFTDADDFRRSCIEAAGGRELRRPTDRISRTPFSAYNIRIHRQTYHGIGGLLRRVVQERLGVVLPMQSVRTDCAWLIEVCPASTLKAEGLYRSYKGSGHDRQLARKDILHGLIDRDLLHPMPPRIETEVLKNAGGDALDSVIAAIAAGRSLSAGRFAPADLLEAIEGRVYF